jgi:hypothetical protein
MRLRLIIIGRNTREFIDELFESIGKQRGGDDVFVDWTDDASDDRSFERAQSWLRNPEFMPDDIELLKNKTRMGGCHNVWRAIQRSDPDRDVCMPIGGDDKLKEGALERLWNVYQNPEVWCTYGNFENSDGRITNKICEWPAPYATRPPKEFIFAPFTFRAWLGQKLCERDLLLAGSFFPASADTAMNIPIVEMAGPERAKFIEEKWYWRRIHPGNDGWVDPLHQHYCTYRANQKPKYGRIGSRDEVPTRSGHVLPYGMIIMPNEPFPRWLALDEWSANEVALGHVMPVDSSLDFKRSPKNPEALWDGEYINADGERKKLL